LSVFGLTCWDAALNTLGMHGSESVMKALVAAELLTEQNVSRFTGTREWLFKHALVRDVAYGQIPKGRRAAKHAAAAEWIEALGSDRTDDRAEMLAHHWSSALSYAPNGGDLATAAAPRARAALIEAGDRALSLNAPSAAATLYAQALTIDRAETDAGLLLRHARSLYLAGDARSSTALKSARAALGAAGDVAGEAFAEAMLSHESWTVGDTDDATRRVERAVQLVESQPASEMKVHVLARAAARAMVANRNEEAARIGREAVALADELDLPDLRINALSSVGSARANGGDQGGLDDLERAFALGIAANSPEAARTAVNLGVSYFLLGDIVRYDELHAESIRISERFGLRQMRRFTEGSQSSLHYFLGDWDAGMASADAFIASCATEPHYQEPHARSIRAAIRFARGDLEGALDDIERALHGASDPQSKAPPLAVASRTYCELGDPRGVATALEALAIEFGATPEPMSSAQLSIIELPPEVDARLREVIASYVPGSSRWVDAARASLDGRFVEAADIYAAMPMRPAEADARLRAAEALSADGRQTEAETQLELALAFWRSVGAMRYIGAAQQVRERFVA
jgi:tetratricopeptide (TPR) repeat protein